jgi:hypothetical protein
MSAIVYDLIDELGDGGIVGRVGCVCQWDSDVDFDGKLNYSIKIIALAACLRGAATLTVVRTCKVANHI